jgi:hypothetical protein
MNRNVIFSGILAGAMVTGTEAFAAPGAPSQRGSPSTLRGATQPLAQSSVGQFSAFPTALMTAVGVAVLGGVAASAGRRAGGGLSQRSSGIVLNFNKSDQLGAQEPLGFWDPANLCADEATFKDFRAKEIKHGRLAMMGALGMLTQSLVQVPGMEGVPKDVTACLVGNGQVGFLAILAIIAGLEAVVFVQDPNKEPGNFGNPLPWFDDYSTEMRAKELNNGRIAMFSAIGIIASSLYTGKPAIEQFSF